MLEHVVYRAATQITYIKRSSTTENLTADFIWFLS